MQHETSRAHFQEAQMEAGETTPEQKELAKSALVFSEHLVQRYPQVDDGRNMIVDVDGQDTVVELPSLPESMTSEPHLNYYLSGSLATTLLAQAETCIELDETAMPQIVEKRTVALPQKAKDVLASFARPIGDLDYVPTAVHQHKLEQTQKLYNHVPLEVYTAARAKLLKKGGGGPAFDEIPVEGRKVLAQSEGQVKLMCDPVQNYGPERVAKIVALGQEYYIARPDAILAYKILHIVQGYAKKKDKFNTDFTKLFEALKEVYSVDALVRASREVLNDYENSMRALHERFEQGKASPVPYELKVPTMIRSVLAEPELAPSIKQVLESVA